MLQSTAILQHQKNPICNTSFTLFAFYGNSLYFDSSATTWRPLPLHENLKHGISNPLRVTHANYHTHENLSVRYSVFARAIVVTAIYTLNTVRLPFSIVDKVNNLSKFHSKKRLNQPVVLGCGRKCPFRRSIISVVWLD